MFDISKKKEKTTKNYHGFNVLKIQIFNFQWRNTKY